MALFTNTSCYFHEFQGSPQYKENTKKVHKQGSSLLVQVSNQEWNSVIMPEILPLSAPSKAYVTKRW